MKVQSDRRALAPYCNQRIRGEGVLVKCEAPNTKNHNPRGSNDYILTFVSVYFPNEDIEIDHIVVYVSKKIAMTLELFDVYTFTGLVEHYMKRVFNQELRQHVYVENYQINEIRKLTKQKTLTNTGLSLYIKNSLVNMVPHVNTLTLAKQLVKLKNDGRRERRFERIKDKLRHKHSHKRYTLKDIEYILYKKETD